MSGILQDIRYALRAMRRSPGLTFVIVASLALGIGANTAIFSVINALLLKPLPYPDPERLAVIWIRNPGINIPQDWPSPGQYFDIQNQQRSFEQMSISRGRVTTLLGRSGNPLANTEDAQSVDTLETSSSLFPLLGARPLHGRLFRAEEDRPGQPMVVILSYRFWSRVFNGDPSIIGKTISLNGLGGGSGETKSQYRSRRRAPAGLSSERRDHANGLEHSADGHLCATAVCCRRRNCAPVRRELQRHGPVEAGRHDGASEKRRFRHRGKDS